MYAARLYFAFALRANSQLPKIVNRGMVVPTETLECLDSDLGPLEAVSDKSFLDLWGLVNTRVVEWEEFKTFPMPPGATVRQTWNALQLLRMHAGKPVGYDIDGTSVLWLNLPQRDTMTLQKILSRVETDSPLDRYARSDLYSHIDVGAQVREATAALAKDGICATYEAVRSVMMGQTPGLKDYERALVNYQKILEEESETEEAAVSGVEKLYCSMTKGCKNIPISDEWHKRPLLNVERVLASASSLDGLGAICAALYVQHGASDHLGIERYAALFGSLLRRVLLIRNGLLALSVLPLACLHDNVIQWKPDVDGDLTVNISSCASEIGAMLDQFERVALEEHSRFEKLRSLVEQSVRLNDRQRRILVDALTTPKVTFGYDGVAETYSVSYNTARTDLTALVNDGFLYTVNDARKLTFVPMPNLPSIIGRKLSSR